MHDAATGHSPSVNSKKLHDRRRFDATRPSISYGVSHAPLAGGAPGRTSIISAAAFCRPSADRGDADRVSCWACRESDQARWMGNILSPLAVRLQFWHPIDFERTLPLVGWLVGWRRVLWMIVVLPAIVLGAQHWRERNASDRTLPTTLQ